jgi:hypothetical protein
MVQHGPQPLMWCRRSRRKPMSFMNSPPVTVLMRCEVRSCDRLVGSMPPAGPPDGPAALPGRISLGSLMPLGASSRNLRHTKTSDEAQAVIRNDVHRAAHGVDSPGDCQERQAVPGELAWSGLSSLPRPTPQLREHHRGMHVARFNRLPQESHSLG